MPEPVSREFRLNQEFFHTSSCLLFPGCLVLLSKCMRVCLCVCECVVGRWVDRHGNETQFTLGSILGCGKFVAKLLTGRLQFLCIDAI